MVEQIVPGVGGALQEAVSEPLSVDPLLLDTNIIVDVLRRRKDARLELEKLLSHDSPLASCPITITEVYAGMRPHEEKSTRAFMKSLIFLPVTEDVRDFPMPELQLYPLSKAA